MNYELMKRVLTNYVAINGKLPEFNIIDPTINGFVEKIHTFNPTKDATESMGSFISKAIDAYSANADVLEDHVFGYIGKLTDTLSERINTAYVEINDIRTQAQAIESDFNKNYNRYVTKDVFMASNCDVNLELPANVDHGMSVIDWKEINMVGSIMDIVSFTNDITNAKADEPGVKLIPVLAHKLSQTPVVDNKPVTIEKEYREALVQSVVENVDVSFDEGLDVVTVLTTPTRVKTFIKKWTDIISTRENKADNIVEVASMIRKFKPFLSEVGSHVQALGPVVVKLMEDNKAAIEPILYGCAYYLVTMRSQVYNDTLIMTNRMINKDNYDAFIADGNSDKDILQYMFVVYPETKVLPELGVSTNIVEERIAIIEDKYKRAVIDVSSKVSFLSKKYKKEAFGKTITEWSIGLAKDENEKKIPMNIINENITVAKAQLNSGAPVDTILTNMLFRIYMPNSFGYSLFKSLDNDFMKYVDNITGNEVDENIINRINSTVIVDVVVDFLKENALG